METLNSPSRTRTPNYGWSSIVAEKGEDTFSLMKFAPNQSTPNLIVPTICETTSGSASTQNSPKKPPRASPKVSSRSASSSPTIARKPRPIEKPMIKKSLECAETLGPRTPETVTCVEPQSPKRELNFGKQLLQSPARDPFENTLAIQECPDELFTIYKAPDEVPIGWLNSTSSESGSDCNSPRADATLDLMTAILLDDAVAN